MSIKVVHVTTVHPAFDIRIFHKECRALAQAGYEVVLVAPCERDEAVDGVQLRAIPRIGSRLRRMTAGAWRAYRRCRAERAAVYHVHDPELLPLLSLLGFRARVVYDMHENVPRAILNKPWIAAPLRRAIAAGYRLLERILLAGKYVVFAEDSYRADYPWVRADRSATVLNMPLAGELPAVSEPRRERPTVCYFGSVSAQRGSVKTIEALALLKARGLDVAFECIGNASPAHLAELRERAGELGLDATFHGYTPPHEGWRIAAQCHIGLALLHPIGNYVDSYPTKLFEYMALGLPVIASDFPLYRGIVDGSGCGVCVDPLDADAIADAIQRLLADPAAASAMGQRGREAVRTKYNWDAEGAKLLAFYKGLLPQG